MHSIQHDSVSLLKKKGHTVPSIVDSSKLIVLSVTLTGSLEDLFTVFFF